MKNTASKIRIFGKIRLIRLKRKFLYLYKSFCRRPFLFLLNCFWRLVFHCIGIILCIILTIVPLPLSHFMQNIMTLNLSFSSVKDVLDSLSRISDKLYLVFGNLRSLIPSPGDILSFLKNALAYLDPASIVSFMRSLPGELQRFFTNLLDNIRQRWRDLKLLCRSLWPPGLVLLRLKRFIAVHAAAVKRLVRNLFQMAVSLILVKLCLLFFIPMVGLGGAFYIFGYNVGFVAIAAVTLLTSQLGSWLGGCLNSAALQFFKNSGVKKYRLTAMLYHKYELIEKCVLRLRSRLLITIDALFAIAAIALTIIYLYVDYLLTDDED